MDNIFGKCKFCPAEPEPAPLEPLESAGVKICFCFSCDVEYLLAAEIFWYSIYIKIKSQTFRWTVFPSFSQLWLINSPGIPGKIPNRDLKMLKSFHPPPEMSPSNIEEKIKIILVFA